MVQAPPNSQRCTNAAAAGAQPAVAVDKVTKSHYLVLSYQ